MKVPNLSVACLPVLLSLAFAGCAPVTPRVSDALGVLRVSGPNVWLNNAPASDGDKVRFGNTLVTGAGSSALLEFRDGGYLQLDQDTDPVFEWLEQSKCILVRIFKGQAFLQKQRACIEGPNLSLVLDSEVNVLVRQAPAASRVTLLRGSARVTVPVQIRLQPGQQLITDMAGREKAVRMLSRAELQSVTGWRKSYSFKPLLEPPTITFPPKPPRRSEPEPPPKPEPAPPTGPSTTPSKWERGLRVPPDLIRRDTEPVIR